MVEARIRKEEQQNKAGRACSPKLRAADGTGGPEVATRVVEPEIITTALPNIRQSSNCAAFKFLAQCTGRVVYIDE